MAYNLTNAKADFDDITLDEFGESVKYTPTGGSEQTILAVIYTTENDKVTLPRGNYNPARTQIVLKISQTDIATVTKDKDTVKFRPFQSDTHERVLTVKSVNVEYGCWVLGVM